MVCGIRKLMMFSLQIHTARFNSVLTVVQIILNNNTKHVKLQQYSIIGIEKLFSAPFLKNNIK